MAVTTEDVKMVAKLSRLNFTEEELEKMREDLSSVIGYVEELNKIDTTNINPNMQENAVLRKDEPKKSIDRTEILKNAPKTDGAYFVVPSVLSE